MVEGISRRVTGVIYPDADYMMAIGEALFNFQMVEQGAVAYVEKIEAGFYAESFDLTAGVIMERFKKVFATDQERTGFADNLILLASHRNALFHARAAADLGEVPVLTYFGREGSKIWDLGAIHEFSTECARHGEIFNRHFDYLSEPGSDLIDSEKFAADIASRVQKWKRYREKKFGSD